MSRSRTSVAAAALLSVLVASSCASPSDDRSGQGGSPIKLLTVGDYSSPTGIGLPQSGEAVKARVAAINAAGGIDGRRVELTACDTRYDPSTATACVRDAIDDGVVAVAGMVSILSRAEYPLLEKAGIPVIGAVPTDVTSANSEVAHCFTSGLPGAFISLPQVLASQGARRISIIYPSDAGPATDAIRRFFKLGVREAGAGIGAEVGTPSTTTQFAPALSKALGGGADGLSFYAPGPATGALAKQALAQAGDGVKLAVIGVALTPQILQDLGPSADGMLVAGLVQPATADTPGMRMLNADMDRHAPDTAKTDLAINAWLSTWVFERVARGLGGDITPERLQSAMAGLKDFDMGGIVPDLTSAAPPKMPGLRCIVNPTAVFQKIENGRLVAVDGEFTDVLPDR